jgi:hypothetical protein
MRKEEVYQKSMSDPPTRKATAGRRDRRPGDYAGASFGLKKDEYPKKV